MSAFVKYALSLSFYFSDMERKIGVVMDFLQGIQMSFTGANPSFIVSCTAD